jgi:hypothetical protein
MQARNQGLTSVQRLLSQVDPKDLDQWWPIIGPVLENMISIQQQAGRDLTLVYTAGIATALGAGTVRVRESAAMRARNGLLPSGMAISRLVRSTPMAVAHRIENGMSPAQAWEITSGHLIGAVADAVHDESRRTAADILKSESVDWDVMDEQFDFSIEREARRVRRNTTERQRKAQDAVGRELFGERWAKRYVRVPNPGACSFCLMLATKGPVYYRDSFEEANSRFRGDGNARAHNHCRCVLMPVPDNGSWQRNLVDSLDEKDLNKVWKDTRYKREYLIREELARATAKEAVRTPVLV